MKPNTVALFRLTVLALSVAATLAFAQAAPPTRTVNVPVLNMFSAASADTDVVSQAIYGTNVKVLDDKGAWAQIQTPDEYKGWVETAKLTALPRAYAAAATNDSKPIYVTSMFAHLYREQSVTKHAPMLTVPFDTALEATSLPTGNERWATVRLVDGRTGYVQSGDIANARKLLTIDEDIALAKKFMGLPYTWGGTSSYGYDCSGFMQMLVLHRGKIMPRDAGPQAHWDGVAPVEKADLKPGDLLYFGRSVERITHTGMYIGDGLFINATTHETPMVRIDNLNEPNWTKLLVAIRRVKQ
jgi:cell wall-associated NlpC family hydrolase